MYGDNRCFVRQLIPGRSSSKPESNSLLYFDLKILDNDNNVVIFDSNPELDYYNCTYTYDELKDFDFLK